MWNGQRKTKSKVLIKRHMLLLATFKCINSKVSYYLHCWHLNLFSECIQFRCFDHQSYTYLRDHTNCNLFTVCKMEYLAKWITVSVQLQVMSFLSSAKPCIHFLFWLRHSTYIQANVRMAWSEVCRKFCSWLTTMWRWCWLHHSVLLSLHTDCLLSMAWAFFSII